MCLHVNKKSTGVSDVLEVELAWWHAPCLTWGADGEYAGYL